MSDWTEDVLSALKRARFRPRAWFKFLAASFARSAETRLTHPEAHRTVVRLAAVGTAASVAVALIGRPTLGWSSAAWWLAACLMVDWHLGLLDNVDHLGLANTLTLARAGVIPAIVVLAPSPSAALLFALAGASDVVDGRIARARCTTTRLGLWLDGSVDGLLLSAVAVVALAPWAAAIVVGRYVIPWIVVGGFYFLRAQRPPLAGFVSGRVPGLVVFAGLLLALAQVRGAPYVAAAGALGGLATFTASVVRLHAAAA